MLPLLCPHRASSARGHCFSELHCFCELYSCLVTREELEKRSIKGIILSGGPASVYEDGAPHVSPAVWDLIRECGLPVLGICYGAQEMVHSHGGTVERAEKREFGPASLIVTAPGELFRGMSDSSQVRLPPSCIMPQMNCYHEYVSYNVVFARRFGCRTQTR